MVVLLIPARTDTKWFRKLVDYGCNIEFVTGRLHFSNLNSAPFPSCYITLTGKVLYRYGEIDIKENKYEDNRFIK